MILVGVILAVVAVGGIVLYKLGQNSIPGIILEDSGVEIVDHSQNFEEQEVVAPSNPESNLNGGVIELELPEYMGGFADDVWPPMVSYSSGQYSCGVGNVEFITIEERIINNSLYCVKIENHGAAGSRYHDYLYTTEHQSGIATVKLSFKSTNCGVYQGSGTSEYSDCQAAQSGFFSQLDTYVDSLIQ